MPHSLSTPVVESRSPPSFSATPQDPVLSPDTSVEMSWTHPTTPHHYFDEYDDPWSHQTHTAFKPPGSIEQLHKEDYSKIKMKEIQRPTPTPAPPKPVTPQEPVK